MFGMFCNLSYIHIQNHVVLFEQKSNMIVSHLTRKSSSLLKEQPLQDADGLYSWCKI